MSEEQIPPRDTWNPIDEALYGPADLYRVDAKEAEKLRLRAIRFSLIHHYTHNRFYRSLCEHRDFNPEDVKTLDDLTKVPLVPDAIFKQYPEPDKLIAWLRGISSNDIKYPPIKSSSYEEIINRLNEYGFQLIFSSGSSGKSSFIPRGDPTTLTRERYFRKHFSRLIGFDPEDSVIFLGPDYRRIHPNWILAHSMVHDIRGCSPDKIFFAADIKVTTENIQTLMGQVKGKTQGDKLETEKVDLHRIQLLEDIGKKTSKGEIHGAPFIINNMLSKMEEQGKNLTLGNRWAFYTGGGGWYGILQADLWKKVERVLGIPERNCRDIYGCTESIVAFPSCEGHYYHIASTLLQPFALDSNLEPVGFGEYGRFGLVEALAHAYPGCIITGDNVKILESCPSCDRPGPVISPPVARVAGVEDRGCAAMMKKLMSEEAERL
jgi:phenylacetate-coenzyme A ligase PaaK-like adenylate-forming protein